MGLAHFYLMRLFPLLALAWLCLCAGCASGGGAGAITPRDAAQNAMPGPELSAAAAYAKLAADPGVAGVDYNPRLLLVDYGAAAIPPALPAALEAELSIAAGKPNALLRPNTQYEPITDAIAQRYGLGIAQQVYYGSVNIACFSVPAGTDPPAVLQQIRSEFAAQIVGAVFSPLRHLAYTPDDPDYNTGAGGVLWDRWQVNCAAGWDYTLGVPELIIAVADTGVRRTHEELSAQVINTAVEFPAALCDVQHNDNDPSDDYGHGTFIAGIIAAEADNAQTLTGVAPHCRLLPIKIGDGGGAQFGDEIAGCILAMNLGARVVNLSFGGYNYVPAEQNMVNELAAAGVFLAVSAGNENTDVDSYPASFTNACAVGATDPGDARSSFSNYGDYVDIAAPGEQMKSTGFNADSAYEYNGGGTSFSCPMVAAAAGLVWSYSPGLGLAEVRELLQTNGAATTGFTGTVLRLDLGAALSAIVPPVVPSATGISTAPDGLYGAVPQVTTLDIALLDAVDVVRAVYTIDLPPFYDDAAEDVVVESTTGPGFAATLAVPTAGNHIAQLRAEYFSTTDTPGAPLSNSQYLFSQRGDINADGAVDMADLDAYPLVLGVPAGAAGYVPFYDSDLDGLITEADAAAVGYYFNGATPIPAVQAVAPDGGYTNEAVTFTATVTGHEPMQYAWDFGGGAVPNTSTGLAPAVHLAAEGTYDASLTLSSMYGADTYDFTLSVGPRPDPTAAFNASPNWGQPPLEAGFDASASAAPGGSIANYQWSWDGDTTWEYESATPDAAHSFTTLGDYTVRLRVTDDLARAAETTAVLHVTSQPPFEVWTEYDLGLWGRYTSTDNLRLTTGTFDGNPALLWTSDIAQRRRSLQLGLAKVAAPTSLADWDMFTLVTEENIRATLGLAQNGANMALAYNLDGDITYGEHDRVAFTSYVLGEVDSNYRYLDLAVIGGKPALFYYAQLQGESAGAMHYAYANTQHPASPADWTVTVIPDSAATLDFPAGFHLELRELNGMPLIQGQGEVDGLSQRVCAYATSATPAPGDWSFYGLGDNEGGTMFYGGLLLQAAAPQLLYEHTSPTAFYISYAVAQSALPTQAGDWASYELYSGFVWRALDAALVGGSPVFAASGDSGGRQTELWLADGANPAAPGDWTTYALPDGVDADNRRVLDHGGIPALVAVIDGPGQDNWRVVYRYTTP